MMSRKLIALALLPLSFAALPATADELPPGLAGARLLPGHLTDQGTYMAALHLVLEPGWKTYWRSPGDAGIPPSFDWTASDNVAAATPHWPVPEVIESGGERTLGYHDELILPIEVTRQDAARPVSLNVQVDFGLCRDVCVPAHVALTAPPGPGTGTAPGPDPMIETALARVPPRGKDSPSCHLSEIADGMRVAATLPAGTQGIAAAMELAQDGVWVSEPELSRDGDRLVATADFVAPSGKPFPLDPARLRLTLIAGGQAVEYQGCAEG